MYPFAPWITLNMFILVFIVPPHPEIIDQLHYKRTSKGKGRVVMLPTFVVNTCYALLHYTTLYQWESGD
jgi:hypothetical protein